MSSEPEPPLDAFATNAYAPSRRLGFDFSSSNAALVCFIRAIAEWLRIDFIGDFDFHRPTAGQREEKFAKLSLENVVANLPSCAGLPSRAVRISPANADNLVAAIKHNAIQEDDA